MIIIMKISKILSKVDHTLLSQTATWDEIKNLCDEAIQYKVASVCIPPSHVETVKKYVGDRMKVCTVVGFPNGYNTVQTKMFEALGAIQCGADEIDMVINIGLVKEKEYDQILNEINLVKKACSDALLKVIIETCLLTKEEIIKMCEIVSESDADYIKTSTGFSKAGANKENIKLMSEHISNGKKIKAAGGISSLDDAEEFIKLGASRIGTSKIVKIVMESEKNQ